MLTCKVEKTVDRVNSILRTSAHYVRRLEVDREDKSIKFINMFNAVIHRHYYNINANAIDLCYDIFDYLTD